MKFSNVLILSLAASSLLNACSTEDSTKVSNSLTAPYLTAADNAKYDGKNLADKIQRMIRKQILKSKVYVTVTNDNVLLVGQVKTASDIEQATAIAKSIPSTKKVFNYLTVNANPKLNTDSSLADEIREHFEKQIDIQGHAVTVVVCDGVVYLLGTNLGNLTAAEETSKGIYSLDGVDKVVYLIQKGPRDYYVKSIQED